METRKIKQWARNNKGKMLISFVVALVICVGTGRYFQDVGKRNSDNTSSEDVEKQIDVNGSQKMAQVETQKEPGNKTNKIENTKTESTKASKTKKATEENDGNSLKAADSLPQTQKQATENSLTINETTKPAASVKKKANDEKGLIKESDEKKNTDIAVSAPPVEKNPVEEDTIENTAEEPKWVVDQPAWTETINEPLHEMQEMSVCNLCGSDITGGENEHLKGHMLNGENGSWSSEYLKVQVGTNTYEVHHEEVGHWE